MSCSGIHRRAFVHSALCLATVVCSAALPHAARAAGPGPSAALQSGDPARVGPAIDALGQRRDRAAVELLAEFLERGQPDALADRALQALGKTGSRESLRVLAQFTHHRRPSARRAAFEASAQIPGEPANEIIAQGLRDSDAGVRGLCALRLGERGAKSQLEVLFHALDRAVPEASIAIGRMGDASAVARLHTHLGQLPIQVMLGGYEQFLVRGDIAEETKLEIVARLGEVAGLTVKRFLEALLGNKAVSGQPRLMHAIAETAKRIDDRPKPLEKKQ
jgi:hypothetical protein